MYNLYIILTPCFPDLGAYGTAIMETGDGGLSAWAKNRKFDFIIHNGDLVCTAKFMSQISIDDIYFALSRLIILDLAKEKLALHF